MHLKPWGMATAIGSLPYLNPGEAVDFVLANLPRIPHWPQLPQRSSLEGLVRQYTGPLLAYGLLTEREGKLSFADDADDWTQRLTAFYEAALEVGGGSGESLHKFALHADSAPGFYAFTEKAGHSLPEEAAFLKGQVTGPVTMGLQLTDSQGKPCFYNDELRGLLLETLAWQAVWQVQELKKHRLPVILFFDDPGLCSYGQSTTVGLSGPAITESFAYLAGRVREAGALMGVHACAGVEWPLVLKAGPDIVNADVYNYFPSLLLCAEELDRFLRGGGTLAWGLVPTGGGAAAETAAGLWAYFSECCGKLAARGVSRELLERQWLLTPACGTGSLGEEQTQEVYTLLKEMLLHQR